jgi:uncharacterized protein (TIGR03083 family)
LNGHPVAAVLGMVSLDDTRSGFNDWVNEDDVAVAVAEMRAVLSPVVSADWQRRAGDLDWTCSMTAEHVAHDLLAYAAQVASSASDAYLPLDLSIPAGTSPADILEVIEACGRLVQVALAMASPDDRAWHWGPTDPGGFAAMAVTEVLVHTYDIARGLGVAWRPPAELAARVNARLFADSPDGDPADVLLWSTGRIELEGHPRKTNWVLKAALS